jgi:hypothetical protein
VFLETSIACFSHHHRISTRLSFCDLWQSRIGGYAVMMAESSGNETAVSPTGDYGLMQINLAAHYSKIPGSTTDEKIQWLFNPYNNISLAKQLYDGSGWSSWNGFTSGSYQQFL